LIYPIRPLALHFLQAIFVKAQSLSVAGETGKLDRNQNPYPDSNDRKKLGIHKQKQKKGKHKNQTVVPPHVIIVSKRVVGVWIGTEWREYERRRYERTGHTISEAEEKKHIFRREKHIFSSSTGT
jgi:hypothetical protein